MKVALAQISPKLGDIEANFRIHADLIHRAKKEAVELLVFPELSLTGYSLRDLTGDLAADPFSDPRFKELENLSRDISFVVGFVEEKQRGEILNSAAFFSAGKILHIHRKVFLPTYGMFEELRFFGQGRNFSTFLAPFGRAGMMICYDFLHFGSNYLLFAGGAEMLIIISAAPGRGHSEREAYGSSRMWELMGEASSRFLQAFVLYCNRVGFEDGKSFAGGSFIFNPGGELLARASYTEEDLLVQDIDLEDIRRFRKRWPYKRDDKPEIILHALQRIVAEYED